MTNTHKAIALTSKGVLESISLPTPKPGPSEVVFKVEYASLIAFDAYQLDRNYFVNDYPHVLGFNGSGTVLEVGSEVKDLVAGDRIAAFTYQNSTSKSMQEYVAVSRTVCAKLPETVSLQAATTIPDNAVTAFLTVFTHFGLPRPTSFPVTSPPANANLPILIYGAGSTAGQYAIQILKLAGYTNVIATASTRHHEYLRGLGAAYVFDYSNPSLVEDILKVTGAGRVPYVLDSVTSDGTLSIISKVVAEDGVVAMLLPIKVGNSVTDASGADMLFELPEERNPFKKSVRLAGVRAFTYQNDDYLTENLLPKIIPTLLKLGLQPNKTKLVEGDQLIDKVRTGLDLLRNNKVSGEKVVVKISDN